MTTPTEGSHDSLLNFFARNREAHYFLNADNRNPMIIHQIGSDYIQLKNTNRKEKMDIITIPLTSIVSVQERQGLGGIVVYLMK